MKKLDPHHEMLFESIAMATGNLTALAMGIGNAVIDLNTYALSRAFTLGRLETQISKVEAIARELSNNSHAWREVEEANGED